MAGVGAILVIFTVLLAAPLALGSYAVAQRAGRTALFAWFGLLTALFFIALIVGFFALLMMSM